MRDKTLGRWAAFVAQQKAIFDWPDWQTIRVVRRSKRKAQALGQRQFVSQAAQRVQLIAQLADSSGVSIEGGRLRITAWEHRPLEDFTATLEFFEDPQWICLARIDAAPPSPHSNIHWRKLGLPAEVKGSHLHSFDDNVRLGREAFTPVMNLPAARSLDLDEPPSFREIRVQGASSAWEIDAIVSKHEQQAIFDLVLPHPNAVNAAVTKFLDIRDLGEAAPKRFAVITDRRDTPHLPLLGRTAQIIDFDAAASHFRKAA